MTPGANDPLKANVWEDHLQSKLMANGDVIRRGQSASTTPYIDLNWCPVWGTAGVTDITDLKILQKHTSEGEPQQGAVMLNGGSYHPPLTEKTDKQVVMRDANGEFCTFHDLLREPHNHLNAKYGCWKVANESNDSEKVGLSWMVLFVPCPRDQDYVEIALQTKYYQATSEQNPNKVWCVNYGSGTMIAAGSTPGGYQCHMNRNEADKPCYVKVEVSNVKASDRRGGLWEMSHASREVALTENLSNDGDIITLSQVPFMPDDSLPMQSSYTDPLAVDDDEDAPVYRCLGGAFTVELKAGSNLEMDEAHANLAHVKDPMHYVAGGHRRAAGLPRIDKIKVIAVKGEVTDEIIAMASDWLDERNAGQLMPLEEVAGVQIKQQSLLPNSDKYQEHLKSCGKKSASFL